MESITPNIFVRDINATIGFYRKLGFSVSMSVPEEGDFVWVMMSSGSVNMMFQTFDSLGDELPAIRRTDGGSLLLYIKVPDVQQLYDSVKGKIDILKEPQVTFYGALEFSLVDNNNYVLTFAQDVETKE